MTQVLIAVDDSESSIATARTAFALFGADASYIVVSVADQTPIVWGGDSLAWGVGYPIMMPSEVVTAGTNPSGDTSVADVDSAPIDAAIQVARDVADEAHIPNPQVVGEVGDPATAIITAAHHHKADVIVIGSHERSWFSKLFVPSVSGAVVREADIPVLVTH
ncbi:MAG TPA: universal stress protein [Ilumatobacteraceae bacterium]|jgi:nucleotide-binding universal stress UspA family protein|nr:universal stress protein [Ilumatobacteraceae bacterium]